MAKKPAGMKRVEIDVNMAVTLASKLSQSDAYWCIPGATRSGGTDVSKRGLTTYLWEDHLGFAVPRTFKIELDYPLEKQAVRVVSPVEDKYHVDSVGDLVWQAAQLYKDVYKDPDAYGVWGHGMGDLVFEALTLYEDGTVTFSVGS